MGQLKNRTGPEVVSTRSRTVLRARSEELAATAIDASLGSHDLSNRHAAARYGICERMVRDYRDGSRAVPLAFVLSLPTDLAADVLRACLGAVARAVSGQAPERSHRQLVAQVGALSAALDHALADGVLTDSERSGLAAQLRSIAERADQAARDLVGRPRTVRQVR